MGLFKKEKKTNYYFASFPELCHYSVICAEMVLDYLRNFETGKEEDMKSRVHEVEHQADNKKHEVTEKLMKEFMTPIDREDIMNLLKQIDDVTDAIEEISLKLYIYNYQELPPDTVPFMELTLECVKKTEECLSHFPEFEDPAKLAPYIQEVVKLEERSDEEYISLMRRLYVEEQNGWVRHKAEAIYSMMESISDQCREVCRYMQTISFKNL